MSKSNGFSKVLGVFALIALCGAISAQSPEPPEQPEPAEAEATEPSRVVPKPTEVPPSVTPEPLAPPDRPRHFGLYAGVAVGNASARELNTSLGTSLTYRTVSTLSFDDHDFGRAAIGWKLPEGRGDFRVVFNGYKETGYDFEARGLQSQVVFDPPLGGGITGGECQVVGTEPCGLPWWSLRIRDGRIDAGLFIPIWNESLDTDEDGAPDFAEILVPTVPNASTSGAAIDSLDNQVQSFDVLYGREFGGRRISSRWWGGLRFQEYRGNTLSAGWLLLNDVPNGFTDGTFLPPIVLSQESSGFGPTGSWEIDFNFFEKRVQLFLRGQVALTFNSMEANSGEFITLLRVSGSEAYVAAPAQLNETRDKSTWQNTGEAGVRLLLKNGLQFEAGFSRTGFLDAVLIPSALTIPLNETQVDLGVSAIYSTQDYLVTGWHAGVAYQF